MTGAEPGTGDPRGRGIAAAVRTARVVRAAMLVILVLCASPCLGADQSPGGPVTVAGGSLPRVLSAGELRLVPVELRRSGAGPVVPLPGWILRVEWYRQGGEQRDGPGAAPAEVVASPAGGISVDHGAWVVARIRAPERPGLYRVRWASSGQLGLVSEPAVTVLVLPPAGVLLLALPLGGVLLLGLLLLVGRLLAAGRRRWPEPGRRLAQAVRAWLAQGAQLLGSVVRAHPWALPLLIFVAALAWRLPFVLARSFPNVLADEMIYTFSARNLAELGRFFAPAGPVAIPNVVPPLYSLVLAPAYLMASHPIGTYRLVLMINALLTASLVLPAGWLARRELGAPPWLAAAAVGLWAVPAGYSMIAMSEALFVPLVLWSIMVYAWWRQRPGIARGVGLGLVVTAILLTRNAGIAMIGALLPVLVLERRPGRSAGGVARLGLVRGRALAARLPVLVLPLASWWLWGVYRTAQSVTARQTVGAYLERTSAVAAGSLADLVTLIRAWTGQLVYLNLASCGLFAVLVAGVVVLRLGRARSPGNGTTSAGGPPSTPVFMALAGLALVAPGTIHMFGRAGDTVLTRHLMYGRYADMAVPLVVLGGLAVLARLARAGERRVAATAVLAGALSAAGCLIIGFMIEGPRVNNIGAAWYEYLVRFCSTPHWQLVCFTGILAALLVLAVAPRAEAHRRQLAVLAAVIVVVLNLGGLQAVLLRHRMYEALDMAMNRQLESIRAHHQTVLRGCGPERPGDRRLWYLVQYHMWLDTAPAAAIDRADHERDLCVDGEELVPVASITAGLGSAASGSEVGGSEVGGSEVGGSGVGGR